MILRATTMRRQAAALAVLLGLAFPGGPARAQEGGFGRFGAIRVDVGPMRALGAGPQAEFLRESLLASLRQSFAGRLSARGPALVVVVRSLSLTPYAGSMGGGRGGYGGGGPTDYLDGEALLVGPGGQVLARHPQLSALPSSSGGAWYDPASERRRVAAIAEHYAQWLARTLPAE